MNDRAHAARHTEEEEIIHDDFRHTARAVPAAGARRVGYRDISLGTHAINAQPYDGRNACDHIGFCFRGCKSGAKWSTLYVEIPKAEATGGSSCALHAWRSASSMTPPAGRAP